MEEIYLFCLDCFFSVLMFLVECVSFNEVLVVIFVCGFGFLFELLGFLIIVIV